MTGKERIVELESEVARLTTEVDALRTKLATGRLRTSAADHKPRVRHGAGRVIGWLVLALMTGAIGLAIGLMLRAEQASFTGLLNWQYNPEALPVSRELAACVVTALAALLFFAARRRLTFYALALLSVYLTYGFYFSAKPAALPMADTTYFWLSKGFLAVGYLLMTLACIRESHAPQRRGRTAAFLSLVNSGVFLYLISEALERRLPHYQWVFLLVSGCVLSVLALLAETSGPRPNYMFAVLLCKAFALITLSLTVVLSGEWLWIAMALECVALAAAYQRSGIILLKLLNLLLLLITFVVCIASVKVPETVLLGDFTIPGNWLFGLGVPTVFAFLAVFYARVARPRSPAERRLSGQWFLAHTFLDVPAPTVAMWHAAAAALLLVTFTIINQGQHATLPAVLAVEAAMFLFLGLIARAPQLDLGGVMLLVAAFASHCFFLISDKPGFTTHPHFRPGMLLVAALTYYAGYRWERHVNRLPKTGASEDELAAAVPYLLATVLLAFLIAHTLPQPVVPIAQIGLGLAMIGLGMLLGRAPVAIAGCGAVFCGSSVFLMGLRGMDSEALAMGPALIRLTAVLAGHVAAERLLACKTGDKNAPLACGGALRTILVLVAALIGLAALGTWAPTERRSLAWLLLALFAAATAFLSSESRYRWTALAMLTLALAAALGEETTRLRTEGMLRHVVLGLATLILLVWSWVRSWYGYDTGVGVRQRPTHEPRGDG